MAPRRLVKVNESEHLQERCREAKCPTEKRPPIARCSSICPEAEQRYSPFCFDSRILRANVQLKNAHLSGTGQFAGFACLYQRHSVKHAV
jgi:hypothetical protein